MEFKKYQHIEKLGHQETRGIEFGTCYVFPKIDGTNASAWLSDDEVVECGSRNRHLSVENDNAGFCAWVENQENIRELLTAKPHIRLFGEWLVPHALKTYQDDAWRNFYVFDVLDHSEEHYKYVPYDVYSKWLEEYGIEYIPPIATIDNPNQETLVGFLERNGYLIKDGEGVGEGVVVKNYNFRNRHGRVTWAKIVTNKFKEKHSKQQPTDVKMCLEMEQRIVDEFVTGHMIDKVYAKLVIDGEWENKMTPRLLNTVFYDLVREESWEFVKKFKNPVVDYRRLMGLTYAKVKSHREDIFGYNIKDSQ